MSVYLHSSKWKNSFCTCVKEMHGLNFLISEARNVHFLSLRGRWQVSAFTPRIACYFSHWRLQLALAVFSMFHKKSESI